MNIKQKVAIISMSFLPVACGDITSVPLSEEELASTLANGTGDVTQQKKLQLASQIQQGDPANTDSAESSPTLFLIMLLLDPEIAKLVDEYRANPSDEILDSIIAIMDDRIWDLLASESEWEDCEPYDDDYEGEESEDEESEDEEDSEEGDEEDEYEDYDSYCDFSDDPSEILVGTLVGYVMDFHDNQVAMDALKAELTNQPKIAAFVDQLVPLAKSEDEGDDDAFESIYEEIFLAVEDLTEETTQDIQDKIDTLYDHYCSEAEHQGTGEESQGSDQ